MCDVVITPPVPRDRKEQPAARLFVTGKNRPLLLATEAAEVDRQYNDVTRTSVEVTNLNGEQTFIPKANIVSIVGITPDEKLPVDVTGALFGKAVTVRGMRQADADELDAPFVEGAIVVTAEDLAREIALILSPDGTDVLYANRADSERVTRRFRRAAVLAAEGVAIFDAEYQAATSSQPAE